MRKLKDVIENSGINPLLIRAVIRQLGGTEYMDDIANHGIDGGFHGFITHSDTFAFYKRNRENINQLVENMADDLGEDPISMVASFNCLKPCDGAMKKAIMVCLGGGRLPSDNDCIDLVANALSWFAAETVAGEFSQ